MGRAIQIQRWAPLSSARPMSPLVLNDRRLGSPGAQKGRQAWPLPAAENSQERGGTAMHGRLHWILYLSPSPSPSPSLSLSLSLSLSAVRGTARWAAAMFLSQQRTSCDSQRRSVSSPRCQGQFAISPPRLQGLHLLLAFEQGRRGLSAARRRFQQGPLTGPHSTSAESSLPASPDDTTSGCQKSRRSAGF